jgi:hypothetical protein
MSNKREDLPGAAAVVPTPLAPAAVAPSEPAKAIDAAPSVVLESPRRLHPYRPAFLLPLLNQGPFFNPVLLVSGPVKICTNDSWVHCIDVKIPEEVYFGLPAQGRVHVPFYKYQKQKSMTHRRMRKKILIRREVNRMIWHCMKHVI